MSPTERGEQTSRAPGLLFHVKACSDRGSVRPDNQDMLLIGSTLLRDGVLECDLCIGRNGEPVAIAAADGMGGHLGGAEASAFVCQRLATVISGIRPPATATSLGEVLETSIISLHHDLIARGAADHRLSGMGTTCTILALSATGAVIAHAGDSRLYRLRNGLLAQLTVDHSLQNLVGDTQIPRSIITNSIGGGRDVLVDRNDLTGRLLAGDVLLICTDGLGDVVTDCEIEALLGEGKRARELVCIALERRVSDNCSVITVDVGSAS